MLGAGSRREHDLRDLDADNLSECNADQLSDNEAAGLQVARSRSSDATSRIALSKSFFSVAPDLE